MFGYSLSDIVIYITYLIYLMNSCLEYFPISSSLILEMIVFKSNPVLVHEYRSVIIASHLIPGIVTLVYFVKKIVDKNFIKSRTDYFLFIILTNLYTVLCIIIKKYIIQYFTTTVLGNIEYTILKNFIIYTYILKFKMVINFIFAVLLLFLIIRYYVRNEEQSINKLSAITNICLIGTIQFLGMELPISHTGSCMIGLLLQGYSVYYSYLTSLFLCAPWNLLGLVYLVKLPNNFIKYVNIFMPYKYIKCDIIILLISILIAVITLYFTVSQNRISMISILVFRIIVILILFFMIK